MKKAFSYLHLPRRNNINPQIVQSPQIMHQPPNAILSCLIKRYSNEIQITRKTRFQYQTSLSLGIIALLVEIMHCEFRGVHYADEVNVEDLEVGFVGLFGFLCV
jgi:hypothetical protein